MANNFTPNLLTRNQFRKSVFERDQYKCVICGVAAKDAHHIIERRLFKGRTEKGGYFLDNGSSLCEKHHIMAEETTLSCATIRSRCGINNIFLPKHFYEDLKYDKWGNIITDEGRIKGELFYNESVQKILKGDDFIDFWIPPKMYALPYSELEEKDMVWENDYAFIGKEVVVSALIDGVDFVGYPNSWDTPFVQNNALLPLQKIWKERIGLLDKDMKVVGKYVFNDLQPLKHELFLSSVWVKNRCLDWEETVEFAAILELPLFSIVYEGIYDREEIDANYQSWKKTEERQGKGYIIRLQNEYSLFNYNYSVAKFKEKKESGLIPHT